MTLSNVAERAKATCHSCTSKRKQQHVSRLARKDEAGKILLEKNLKLQSEMQEGSAEIERLRRALVVLQQPAALTDQLLSQLHAEPSDLDQLFASRSLSIEPAPLTPVQSQPNSTSSSDTWAKRQKCTMKDQFGVAYSFGTDQLSPDERRLSGDRMQQLRPSCDIPEAADHTAVKTSLLDAAFDLDMLEVPFHETENDSSADIDFATGAFDLDMLEVPFLETENDSSADIEFATGAGNTLYTALGSFQPCNIATALLGSNSHPMLHCWAATRDVQSIKTHEQLPAALNAENWSAPGFSTGNAIGRCVEGSEFSFEPDAVSSSSEIAESIWLYGFSFFGAMAVYICTLLNNSESRVTPSRILWDRNLLPEVGNQLLQLLGLVCLLGAVGCYYLPVWDERLLRKLSLESDDAHAMKEVQKKMRWALFVAAPLTSMCQACWRYHVVGVLWETLVRVFLLPTLFTLACQAVIKNWQSLLRVRQLLLVVCLPIFCMMRNFDR